MKNEIRAILLSSFLPAPLVGSHILTSSGSWFGSSPQPSFSRLFVSLITSFPRLCLRPEGMNDHRERRPKGTVSTEPRWETSDRKVMPGERSSSGSSAHIVVPLGRSPGPTVLPSDSRLTAHILRTPGTRGTREATTEGTE